MLPLTYGYCYTTLQCSSAQKRHLRKAKCSFPQLSRAFPATLTKPFSPGSSILAQYSLLSSYLPYPSHWSGRRKDRWTDQHRQRDCSTWPRRRLFLVTPKDYHGAKLDDIFYTSTVNYLMPQLFLELFRKVLMRFMLTARLIAASIEGTVLAEIDCSRWQDLSVFMAIWIPAQSINDKGRVKTTGSQTFSLVVVFTIFNRHYDRTSDNSREHVERTSALRGSYCCYC